MADKIQYGCSVCGWIGPASEMEVIDTGFICPECKAAHFLHPCDMDDPSSYAATHRTIMDEVRVLRKARKIERLPQWLRSWDTRAWKVYKTDREVEA
jgi:hypothetical protein